MIPVIGLMVGCYIITRMTSFLTRSGDRKETRLVQVFAGITIIVTLLAVADLMITGVSFNIPGVN